MRGCRAPDMDHDAWPLISDVTLAKYPANSKSQTSISRSQVDLMSSSVKIGCSTKLVEQIILKLDHMKSTSVRNTEVCD